jgi:hypothetical protein
MKVNYLKLICGLTLLGAAATTSAQTTLVAGWADYNSISQTFPYAATATGASVDSAIMNASNLYGINDDRGLWGCINYATTLDTTTAPYLSWTINLGAGETVYDGTFFLNLAKNSCLVSLRSSLDNYATSIADLSGSYYNLQNFMVPVGTVTGSVTYRLYVYDVAAGTPSTSTMIGDEGCSSFLTTIGGTYDSAMNGDAAGLLGTEVVPEPASVALAAVGGLGWLFLRRRRK